MNGKVGNRSKKLSISELKDYLLKRKYDRYIFSSNYQSNINNYTLRCSMMFNNLDVLFNPNKIFMHNGNITSNSGDKQYLIIERVKCIRVKELDTGIMMDIICGNVSNDIDNHTYTVVAEFSTK